MDGISSSGAEYGVVRMQLWSPSLSKPLLAWLRVIGLFSIARCRLFLKSLLIKGKLQIVQVYSQTYLRVLVCSRLRPVVNANPSPSRYSRVCYASDSHLHGTCDIHVAFPLRVDSGLAFLGGFQRQRTISSRLTSDQEQTESIALLIWSYCVQVKILREQRPGRSGYLS